ncbi:MAG: hypothetical protein IIZ78_01790 [Clostridiales bacterium]|nr:hypothetical protein [Clostridiales bacterium]
MQRTILITRVRDPVGNEYDIIGKYDIKKFFKQGLKIISQRTELRFMDELTYYNNSYKKE